MKTGKKIISIQQLVVIANSAATIAKENSLTKIAGFCEAFLELNTALLEEHNKKCQTLAAKTTREYQLLSLSYALEENGSVQKHSDGSYAMSKEDAIKLLEAQHILEDKVNAETHKLILKKVAVTTIQLPCSFDNFVISYNDEKLLNGYVFTNTKKLAPLKD